MKSFISTSCALLLISTVSVAQVNEALLQADSLQREGQLVEAIAIYRNYLEQEPDNQSGNYNLACSYALLNMRDSAFHFLDSGLAQDTSVRALTDPDLFLLMEDERWEEVVNRQIEKVEAKYGQYPRLELSKELWGMSMADQAYYYHIHVAEKQMGRRNPVITALWQLKQQLNTQNEQRLEEIIGEHGWPKRSEVKGSASQAAFLVIQHADLELQKKYISLLKETCEAGEADWSGYALMYDRIEMREGRPQLYGSQVRTNNETGQYEPYTIKDPEYVNKRRKEVGLAPIEAYLGHWDIKWEVEQKE